jgi:hypothetical protein
MKRRDLIKTIEGLGCVLVRHGRKHDWYLNPITKETQPIPRHTEINGMLAQHIIKKLR